MQVFENVIMKNGLMVELWWEPGDNEFRATVRKDMGDEGWTGSGDDTTVAIIMALAVYREDTKIQEAS